MGDGPHNVALIGKARSGKDTAAERLSTAHGYTRVAFADPLKTYALEVNPVVGRRAHGADHVPVRLADSVRIHGWNGAKETPEVRRLLQQMGNGIRAMDPGFWIRRALLTIGDADGPVVVSDVRYYNEAWALRAAGFTLVRVLRPGFEALTGAAAAHVSENELNDFPADVCIVNGGSLTEFHARVDELSAA